MGNKLLLHDLARVHSSQRYNHPYPHRTLFPHSLHPVCRHVHGPSAAILGLPRRLFNRHAKPYCISSSCDTRSWSRWNRFSLKHSVSWRALLSGAHLLPPIQSLPVEDIHTLNREKFHSLARNDLRATIHEYTVELTPCRPLERYPFRGACVHARLDGSSIQ